MQSLVLHARVHKRSDRGPVCSRAERGAQYGTGTADGIPIDYVTTTPAMKAYGIFQVCMMRGWALPGAKCSKSPLPGQLGMRGVVGLSHS